MYSDRAPTGAGAKTGGKAGGGNSEISLRTGTFEIQAKENSTYIYLGIIRIAVIKQRIT